MEATSLWDTLRQETSQPDQGWLGLKAWLYEKLEMAQYRPQAAPGVIASRLTGRDGVYYVLKNPATKTYYRLSDRDHFLWERMDGRRTVKDLVVAYFLEYGSFAFARVAALVEGLKAGLLLSERPVNVYQRVRGRLLRRRPQYRLARVWQSFLQRQFTIGGLDRALSGVYRRVGGLLFARPVLILYLLVTVLGFYAFVQALRGGQYGVVTIAGSIALGMMGLIVANLFAVLIHEMAHALTVKHYGREVRRGGFMIYFGMPAFFVDTTDIWLEGKRARLAVTWAGPYSGLILGGLASIVLFLWPAFALNPLLFQFAFLSYLTVFFNLNPLLELDGYYLLMDWLDIPMLRRKSLAFIRGGLWEKVKAVRQEQTSEVSKTSEVSASPKGVLPSFSREEKIFTVFGLLSAAWTAYAILMGAYFWQRRLAGALRDLWTRGGGVGRILLALGLAALSLLLVLSIGLALLSMVRKVVLWAARKGLFANPWNVAALLLAAAVALSLVPAALSYRALTPVIGVAALSIAAFLAWRIASDYAGSRLSPVFWLIGLFSLALVPSLVLIGLVGTGAIAVKEGQPVLPILVAPVAIGLAYLAYGALAVAGLLLFSGAKLKEMSRMGKALLVLGLAGSYGLVLWLVARQQQASPTVAGALLTVSGWLLPLLTLALMAPTLVSFWRTSFGPAWTLLIFSLGGMAVSALTGRVPLLAYLLLAGGLLLHHLAFRSIALLSDQPRAVVDLSDGRRLQRALGWTVSDLVEQFRQIAGDRAARNLVERFNNYALAAGWAVSIVAGQVEEATVSERPLIEQGEIYAAVLGLLLDLTAEEVGEKLAVRSLQRAYDGLPWEEREIGVQYLFREVKRAESLSADFQTVQQDYRRLLQRMPLFATMDGAEVDLVCSRLRVEHHGPGRAVIRQGERGDRFFIVRHGHVEVTQRDERGVSEVVNQLDRGGYFGELALLHDAPRNATCRTTIPTELLSLSRRDFEQLVKARFALRDKVDRSITQVELLRRVPLFAEMGAQQLRLVAAQLQAQTYEPGAALMRQGEMGETFYVIESGRVQVSVGQDGELRVAAERGPGEYVGEIALLLQVPRTATVTALAPTRVLALTKDDFDRLVSEHLYVGRQLERDTSRRLLDLQRVA